MFGEFWCTGYGDGYSTEYNEDGLILQFKRLAYSIEADIIFDHVQDPRVGRRGVLKAYDSCGNLLKAVYVDGDARAPVSYHQARVDYPTRSPIARVTIGGADGGWVQIDNIVAHLNNLKKPACVR